MGLEGPATADEACDWHEGRSVNMRVSVGAAGASTKDGAHARYLAIELYFAVYLALAFAYAALCPPSRYAYDLSLVRAIVMAASSSVTLWQLRARRRRARVIALTTVGLCLALSAADLLGLGGIVDIADAVGMPLAVTAAAIEMFGAGFVTYGLVLDDAVKGQLAEPPNDTPAHEGGHSWDMPLARHRHVARRDRQMSLPRRAHKLSVVTSA